MKSPLRRCPSGAWQSRLEVVLEPQDALPAHFSIPRHVVVLVRRVSRASQHKASYHDGLVGMSVRLVVVVTEK